MFALRSVALMVLMAGYLAGLGSLVLYTMGPKSTKPILRWWVRLLWVLAILSGFVPLALFVLADLLVPTPEALFLRIIGMAGLTGYFGVLFMRLIIRGKSAVEHTNGGAK